MPLKRKSKTLAGRVAAARKAKKAKGKQLTKKQKSQVRKIAKNAVSASDKPGKTFSLAASSSYTPFTGNPGNRVIAARLHTVDCVGLQLGPQAKTSSYITATEIRQWYASGWMLAGAGSHNPRGWDQLIALYNPQYYRVKKLRVHWRVTFGTCSYINVVGESSVDCQGAESILLMQACNRVGAGTYDSIYQDSVGFPTEIMEITKKNKFFKYKYIKPGQTKKLTMTLSPRDIYGHDLDEDEGWTAVASNPSTFTYSMKGLIIDASPSTNAHNCTSHYTCIAYITGDFEFRMGTPGARS